jgi:hypothetical protein
VPEVPQIRVRVPQSANARNDLNRKGAKVAKGKGKSAMVSLVDGVAEKITALP